MCSETPTPRDFLTLLAAKNNLQLTSVLGVFSKRRFNTYVTKDVMVFLNISFGFPKEIKNLLFFPRCFAYHFFQGGPVYHVFPKGDQESPPFPRRSSISSVVSKEIQPLLVLI